MEVADNGLEHRLGPLLPCSRPTVQKKPQRRSEPRSLRHRILEPLPSRVIELDVRDILAPQTIEAATVLCPDCGTPVGGGVTTPEETRAPTTFQNEARP